MRFSKRTITHLVIWCTGLGTMLADQPNLQR